MSKVKTLAMRLRKPQRRQTLCQLGRQALHRLGEVLLIHRHHGGGLLQTCPVSFRREGLLDQLFQVLHGIPGERRPSVRSDWSEVAPAFGLRVLEAPLSLRRDTPTLALRQPVPRSQSAGETGRTLPRRRDWREQPDARLARFQPFTPESREEPVDAHQQRFVQTPALQVFKEALPADRAFLLPDGQMQQHLRSIILDSVGAQHSHRLRVFGSQPKVDAVAEQVEQIHVEQVPVLPPVAVEYELATQGTDGACLRSRTDTARAARAVAGRNGVAQSLTRREDEETAVRPGSVRRRRSNPAGRG